MYKLAFKNLEKKIVIKSVNNKIFLYFLHLDICLCYFKYIDTFKLNNYNNKSIHLQTTTDYLLFIENISNFLFYLLLILYLY